MMKNLRAFIELIAGLSVLLGFAFGYGVLNNRVEGNSCEIHRVESKHDADMVYVKINLANINNLQFEMNGTLKAQAAILRQLARTDGN
jgi:hypothetical protein